MSTVAVPTTDIPSEEALSRQTFFNPDQTEHIKQQILQLEWQLQGRSEHSGMPMPKFTTADVPFAPQDAVESLDNQRDMLKLHDPEALDVNHVQKNKLYTLMLKLEREIKEGMPSYEMMERPLPGHVDHHMAWSRQNKKKVLAWRACRRILDPKNREPNFCSIELLRTADPPRVDLRKYRLNYDSIDFLDKVETDLDQVSDTQYLEFLRLKALGWSAPSICKDMGWRKETYQVALRRLQQSDSKSSAGENGHVSPPSDLSPETAIEYEEPGIEPEPMSTAGSVAHSGGDASFGAWLKGALKQRRIVKRAFAEALKIRLDQLYQGMAGKRPFKPDVQARAKGLLDQFDQNPALLPVHEEAA